MKESNDKIISLLQIAFCITIVILAVISFVVWNSFKNLESIEEYKFNVDELGTIPKFSDF